MVMLSPFAASVEGTPVMVTVGVMQSFTPGEVSKAMLRHINMDWQDMDEEDAQANHYAATQGAGRVLSAYRVRAKAEERPDLWIITEADRSSTTVLLPSEY